jgi:hypothetical protein
MWDPDRRSNANGLMLERALKLQNYFTRPFFVADPYTKRPGVTVSLAETLCTCREILEGQYDDLSTGAFLFSGGMAEIQTNMIAASMLAACAGAIIKDKMASFAGQPVSAAIDKLSFPTEQTEIAGRKVYIWSSRSFVEGTI